MAAGGRLLDASGNVLLDDSGNEVLDDGAGNTCCCGVPCTCPGGLAGTYTDTDYATIHNCLSQTGQTAAAWDGTFALDSTCTWTTGKSAYNHSGGTTTEWQIGSTGGTIQGTVGGGSLIELVNPGGGAACYWHMIVVGFPALPSATIWEGTKTTGLTPVGTYTRIAGCDTTPTRTVV